MLRVRSSPSFAPFWIIILLAIVATVAVLTPLRLVLKGRQ
jgi:hypothetical protein